MITKNITEEKQVQELTERFGVSTLRALVQLANRGFPDRMKATLGERRFFNIRIIGKYDGEIHCILRRGGRSKQITISLSPPKP